MTENQIMRQNPCFTLLRGLYRAILLPGQCRLFRSGLFYPGEWSRAAPHPVDDVNGEKQPGQILQQDDLRMWRSVGTTELFAQYNDNVCHHHRTVDDAGDADPLFALAVGINGDDVEGAKEEGIDPYSGFPPGRPGN